MGKDAQAQGGTKRAGEWTASDLERLTQAIAMRVGLPNGATYTFTLADAVAISPDDIQGELIRHAARYAFYARLHVDARLAAGMLHDQLKEVETAVDLTVRAAIESELTMGPRGGAPKVSETEVKRRVSVNERVVKLRKQLTDVEADVDRLAVVREALTHRREMLTAIAMFRAPEGSAGPGDRAQYRLQHGR